MCESVRLQNIFGLEFPKKASSIAFLYTLIRPQKASFKKQPTISFRESAIAESDASSPKGKLKKVFSRSMSKGVSRGVFGSKDRRGSAGKHASIGKRSSAGKRGSTETNVDKVVSSLKKSSGSDDSTQTKIGRNVSRKTKKSEISRKQSRKTKGKLGKQQSTKNFE